MKYFLVFFLCFSFPLSEANASETYECVYDSYSDKQGNHASEMKITFLVDDKARKSYIIGNNGSSEVAYMDRGNGVSFIEITDVGNVMTTAISQSMDSVHSRNSVMGDKLIPSQYYGTCIKK